MTLLFSLKLRRRLLRTRAPFSFALRRSHPRLVQGGRRQGYTSETDPGVLSVRSIYACYKTHGIKTVGDGRVVPQRPGRSRLCRLRPPDHRPEPAGGIAEGIRPARNAAVAGKAGRAGAHEPRRKTFRWLLNEDRMATGFRRHQAVRQDLRIPRTRVEEAGGGGLSPTPSLPGLSRPSRRSISNAIRLAPRRQPPHDRRLDECSGQPGHDVRRKEEPERLGGEHMSTDKAAPKGGADLFRRSL